MFIGAINPVVQGFLAREAAAFDHRLAVIGCSGNFTSEAVLTQHSRVREIHSNDVSFYSCLAGNFLAHTPMDFEVVDPAFEWLLPFLNSDAERLASIMVLLDVLAFEKVDKSEHNRRMFQAHQQQFGDLVAKTVAKIQSTPIRLTSFFAGDVFEHFKRFADRADAIFCCYAPTYVGGYEKMYKRLHEIVRWNEPTYAMLDDAARDALVAWIVLRC